MNYYCEHGIVPHDCTLPAESDTIIVQREVSFNQIASKCDVTLDGLRALNPQYRKDIVPANYTLRLPQSCIDTFLANEDSIYALDPSKGFIASSLRRSVTEDVDKAATASSQKTSSRQTARQQRQQKRQRTKYASVKSGDTLSAIAKRNGTTVSQLKKLNGLKNDMIHPGQSVRVK